MQETIDFRKLGVEVVSIPELFKDTPCLNNVDKKGIAEIEQKFGLISLRQVYLPDQGLKGMGEADRGFCK